MKCKETILNGRALKIFADGRIYEKSYVDARGHVRAGRELAGSNLDGYRMIRVTKDKNVESFLIHRLVADCFCDKQDDSFEVDHINGDRSDNRSENLRWVSHRDNLRGYNKPQRGGTSKFRGVYKSNGMWVAQIGSDPRTRRIGTFTSEKEAAKEFNSASIALGWPKESLNKGLHNAL